MSEEKTAADQSAGVKTGNLPQHVAIIMDGNGRWARARGLSRLNGHKEGAESIRAVLQACRDLGIKYLTLYAFSVENWRRPKSEIAGLMNLLVDFLKSREKELHTNKVRLRVTGRINDLPPLVQEALLRVMKATEAYKEGQLILALSYGGRSEITDAVKSIAEEVKNGSIEPASIDENIIRSFMYLPDVPDPDLLIRTSGEMRVSNFLLWQISYTELYVTDVMWPDFRAEDLKKALDAYAKRKRKFGDIK